MDLIGSQWYQCKNKKAYIGTYQSEKEAALAFDFYSIMLHALDAKTNFSYSKDMIMEMIINYKSSPRTLP